MNRDSYNTIAPQWAAARRTFHGRERDYLDLLLAPLPQNACVLDLGCGTGRPMAEYVLAKGFRVIGVDQSGELLKIARADFPSARWVLAALETYAFPDSFGAALLWDSLFHIERSQHEPLLRRVIERLPAGGRLMLTAGGSAHPAFTDRMYGQTFFYDSNPPEITARIVQELGCRILLAEFTNLPTAGRDKGRYALVAEKA